MRGTTSVEVRRDMPLRVFGFIVLVYVLIYALIRAVWHVTGIQPIKG